MTKSERPITVDRIYADSDDRFGVPVVYSDGYQKPYYFDKEKNNQVPDENLLHLFAQGVLVLVNGSVYARPTCYSQSKTEFVFSAGEPQ